MERYAHRRLAHAEALGSLTDRASIDGNCRYHRTLAGGKRLESAANFPLADRLGFRLDEGFGNLADLDFHPASAAAKGVDQLVTRNRIEPRHNRRIAPPRMALHVNGKQRLLHDVL